MTNEERAHHIVQDKNRLDAHVYTPWPEALRELERRQGDAQIDKHLQALLPHGVPLPIKERTGLVLFRHVATPNYEINRFMACADSLQNHRTVIFEYTGDQFNDRNQGKYFLGKMRFHVGMNKDGDALHENHRIIDFNRSNSKKLSEIQTDWGQDLVDFHHEMFDSHYPRFIDIYHDISPWLHKHGTRASDYYKSFLALFVKHAVLFENFLLDKRERDFTETVILPALIEIEQITGKKPLIVTMAPTKMEADEFWYSYPEKIRDIVTNKFRGSA